MSLPPGRPTVSPEEVAKKQQLLHMWKEHKAAIEHEGSCNRLGVHASHNRASFIFTCFSTETTVKVRLELIKAKALELIDNLQVRTARPLLYHN